MQLTTANIKQLKGCAISILCLGLLDPQPHPAKWYKMMSGYSDKPVTEALAYLTEINLMLKVPKGWIIATDQQLILSTENEKLSTGYPQVIHNSQQKSRNNSDSSEKSRNNSDSLPLVVSSSLILKDKDSFKDLTTTTREGEIGIIPIPPFDANLKACLENGIQEPKASEIAKMDHVTPEYILHHVEDAITDDKEIGAAIYRITQRWTPRKRKDYQADKYAEFYD